MMTHRIVPSFCLLALAPLLSVPAPGKDFNCPPDFGDRTVKGNIVIAAPCRLIGTEVKGNVRLFEGGSLIAIAADIDGNVKAQSADFIDVRNTEIDGHLQLNGMVGDISHIQDSRIDGNVALKDSRSRFDLRRNYIEDYLQIVDNSAAVLIDNNIIDGNLQLTGTTGGVSLVQNNTIDGNVALKDNRLRFELHQNHIEDNLQIVDNIGVVLIDNNIVDGNLHCKDNNPAPEGQGNSVSGNNNGQCEKLEASGDDPAPGSGGQDEGNGTGPAGGSGNGGTSGADDGGDGDGSDSELPPLELNSGTGGGGAGTHLFMVYLLVSALQRFRPRVQSLVLAWPRLVRHLHRGSRVQ